MTCPALEVRGLFAGYARETPVVKGIDLTLEAGEFVAVLGPNGAGKSTFVKALSGVAATFAGTVRLHGADIAGTPAHAILRRGLAFVPQTESVFTTLTIRENLQLAAQLLPKPARAAAIDRMLTMFPDLARAPGRAAGALSGGQRQMLAAARVLLLDPRLLILDEPSAGLSPKLVAEVFATLARVRDTGVTMLLVEQNVRAALAVAQRAVVLVEGRLRHDALAAELAADPNLGRLFLGAEAAE